MNSAEKLKELYLEKRDLSRIQTVLKISNYVENVTLLWKQRPFLYDKAKIFWVWNKDNFCWEIVDETDILIIIDQELGFAGQLATGGVKNNYLEAFRQVGRVRMPEPMPKTWIQFKNKVFDIKTKTIFEATPNYFTCNPIIWEIGESEETPILDKLFEEWVGELHKTTLYEIISYCCLPDYPIHIFFTLIGSGRNGKSQFIEFVSRFLGKLNIASAELDRIADSSQRFESAKLYKKLACFMSETNFGVIENTAMLKKLTGGDAIGFEIKNKNPFNDYNYAKIIVASNSLPISVDTSDGFYRRWLIIDFPNEFEEGKDIINGIPEQEYQNLAKKVLKILPNLIENGMLTHQGTIEERKQKFIFSSNPISLFIKSFCYEDYTVAIKYNELFNAYKKFLFLHKKRPLSWKEFRGILEYEGLYVRHTKIEGEQAYWIDGLRLKEDWEKLIEKSILKNIYSNIEIKQLVSKISKVSTLLYPPIAPKTNSENTNFTNLTNRFENSQLNEKTPLSIVKGVGEINPSLSVSVKGQPTESAKSQENGVKSNLSSNIEVFNHNNNGEIIEEIILNKTALRKTDIIYHKCHDCHNSPCSFISEKGDYYCLLCSTDESNFEVRKNDNS